MKPVYMKGVIRSGEEICIGVQGDSLEDGDIEVERLQEGTEVIILGYESNSYVIYIPQCCQATTVHKSHISITEHNPSV